MCVQNVWSNCGLLGALLVVESDGCRKEGPMIGSVCVVCKSVIMIFIYRL